MLEHTKQELYDRAKALDVKGRSAMTKQELGEAIARKQDRRLDSVAAMKAVVIYESLTGNTARAAGLIGDQLAAAGVPTVVCPVDHVDYQALSEAELVVVGTWTDGAIFIGQRPGRAYRLRAMPAMSGKKAVVFATYAIDAGKVLDKLVAIVEDRGAEVLGGMTIRRDRLERSAGEFVDRVLATVAA